MTNDKKSDLSLADNTYQQFADSICNLLEIELMRMFYLAYPEPLISETVSRKLGYENSKGKKSEQSA